MADYHLSKKTLKSEEKERSINHKVYEQYFI